MDKSLFEITLDTNYYNLLALNDALRIFVIQVVVQGLFVLRNPEIDFFAPVFIENTLFIVAGVLIYWLVFNHILSFKLKDTVNKDKEFNNYYQSVYMNNI